MTDYSLLPDEFNFVFWQGDTINIEFTVVDELDDAVNLSTHDIKSQIRDPQGQLITDTMIIETSVAVGKFEIFIPHDVSVGLQPDVQYDYDIQLSGTKTINGQPYDTINTIVFGTFIVHEEYTVDTEVGAFVQVAQGEKPSYRLRRGGL